MFFLLPWSFLSSFEVFSACCQQLHVLALVYFFFDSNLTGVVETHFFWHEAMMSMASVYIFRTVSESFLNSSFLDENTTGGVVLVNICWYPNGRSPSHKGFKSATDRMAVEMNNARQASRGERTLEKYSL